MISRLILAAIAGAVAFLICIFVGGLLAVTGIPLLAFVGNFLKEFAVVISILVALASYFGGYTPFGPKTP